MTTPATWLLENHTAIVAKIHFYSTVLQDPSILPDDTSIDPGSDSDNILSELFRIADTIKVNSGYMENQYSKYRFLLLLYDILVESLSTQDRWLVQQIFDEHMPLDMIAQSDGVPIAPMAKSTICRHKSKIIAYADQFLSELVPH